MQHQVLVKIGVHDIPPGLVIIAQFGNIRFPLGTLGLAIEDNDLTARRGNTKFENPAILEPGWSLTGDGEVLFQTADGRSTAGESGEDILHAEAVERDRGWRRLWIQRFARRKGNCNHKEHKVSFEHFGDSWLGAANRSSQQKWAKTNMTVIYHDEDGDLNVLSGKSVAIIGYGNMGRPVALNLRDSGVSVLVSEPREEKRDHAVREGFELFQIRDAVESADIIMPLLRDEEMARIYIKSVSPWLHRGHTLIFSSAYNLTYGLIEAPPFVDVGLVSARTLVRPSASAS